MPLRHEFTDDFPPGPERNEIADGLARVDTGMIPTDKTWRVRIGKDSLMLIVPNQMVASRTPRAPTRLGSSSPHSRPCLRCRAC
jgi:hypothetical protein